MSYDKNLPIEWRIKPDGSAGWWFYLIDSEDKVRNTYFNHLEVIHLLRAFLLRHHKMSLNVVEWQIKKEGDDWWWNMIVDDIRDTWLWPWEAERLIEVLFDWAYEVYPSPKVMTYNEFKERFLS